MSIPLAAVLVLVAASLAWSGLDLLRKLLVAEVSALPLLVAMTLGLVPVFALWVAVDGRTAVAPGYVWPALASVLLNIAANLAFFEAVKRSPLSLTIPFLSFTPAFAALGAVPLLGERPRALQVAGIALVVAGGLVIHSGGGGALLGALRSLRAERGSVLMLWVALLWGATISFDKIAIGHASEPMHGMISLGGVGLGALVILAVRGRLGDLAQLRRRPGLVALALVAGSVALGLQLVAIKLLWVSLVESVKRGIGNTVAVVLGRTVFGEPVTASKVAAVLLMAAGVVLVAG